MSRAKELPPVPLEMFQPSGRSDSTNRKMGVIFGELYGPAGREFFRGMRDGSMTLDDIDNYRDAIRTHYYYAVAEIYGLPPTVNPVEFVTRQQETALKTVTKVIKTVAPNLERHLGFMNEAKFKSEDPTHLFRILALPDGSVEPKLRAQVIRHLLLSHIAGMMDLQLREHNARTQLAEMQDLFDRKLFEGKYGETVPHTVFAYHDNKTNEVKGFKAGDQPNPFPTRHLMSHYFNARRVRGNLGLVYIDLREKDMPSAITKGVAKAANNGGVIDPFESVHDHLGMLLVALEGPILVGGRFVPQRELVVKRIQSFLGENMPGVKIEGKPHKRDRGQSEKLDSKRFMITPEGGIPTEWLAFDKVGYLNQRWEVGKLTAHRLWEIIRLYPALPYLFPKEVTGGRDIQDEARAHQEVVKRQLLAECREDIIPVIRGHCQKYPQVDPHTFRVNLTTNPANMV